MLRWQRLLAEHVQHGAGDLLFSHRGDQVGIPDQVAAAEIQQPRRRFHMRQPLGIAIVGGLLLSQALTLYSTPVIYLYMDRFRLWGQRLRGGGATPLTPGTTIQPGE